MLYFLRLLWSRGCGVGLLIGLAAAVLLVLLTVVTLAGASWPGPCG